jgi:hypothetical protein
VHCASCGHTFGLATVALAALSTIVRGDKLTGMAAAVVTGAFVGILAGIPTTVLALIFLRDDADNAPPGEVLDAIDDLRIYVASALMLDAEGPDEDMQAALVVVDDWLDTLTYPTFHDEQEA